MAKETSKSRRRAVKTMAAGVAAWPALTVLNSLAQGHAGHPAPAEKAGAKKGAKKEPPFKPAFFSAREFAAVSAVCERIIPTDATPGAREARVAEFVDLMVSQQPELHGLYRKGLAWLEEEAQRRHKLAFVKLAAARQDAMLRSLGDVKEPAPENIPAQFFRSVRGLTVDGFYTSKVGLKDLGYIGNTYLLEYKGCTHPEHGG